MASWNLSWNFRGRTVAREIMGDPRELHLDLDQTNTLIHVPWCSTNNDVVRRCDANREPSGVHVHMHGSEVTGTIHGNYNKYLPSSSMIDETRTQILSIATPNHTLSPMNLPERIQNV